jgi:hypothetical protein
MVNLLVIGSVAELLSKETPFPCSAGVTFLQRREQPCHTIAHLAG